jgi:hypothetical protein
VAPRRPPQRRGSQSPNTVLVIFLIFFFLAAFVAGILAWYGYDGQKKLREDAAKAENKAKAASKAEEWALLQSFVARKAMGAPLVKADSMDEQTAFDADLLGMKVTQNGVVIEDPKFKEEKNKAAVEEMFTKAVQDLGWDPTNKKFGTTYRERIKSLSDEVTKARAAYATALAQKEALKDEIEKLAAANKQWYETESAKIKDSGEKALAAAIEKTKEIGELLKSNAKLSDDLKQLKDNYEQQLRTKEKRIFELSQALGVKKEQVAENGGAPAAPTGAGAAPHALLLDVSQGKPLWDRPVAKVTRVDAQGRKAYINKGSAQGIRPQMTFTVFAAGAGGKAEGMIKGTLEVQEVLDANTSVAWVTSLYDADGHEIPLYDTRRNSALRQIDNPIREGDLLFNPAFGAHVAVAGAPDWTGTTNPAPAEQMRQLRLFLAQLRKQGITVDAYLDLTDGQVKGAVTPRTNYLIRGQLPRAGDGADASAKVAQVVAEAAQKMQQEAVAQGAFIISVDNFLTVIGYRRPHSSEEAEVSTFRPRLPTAGTGNIGKALAGGKGQ